MYTTDCRSDEGVTVGLVDALISIARVLSRRDFSFPAAQEALKDLVNDEDMLLILGKANNLGE